MAYNSAIYAQRVFAAPETTQEQDYANAARRYALTGDPSQIPVALCCPISKDLMVDPVLLYDASTKTAGATYDRRSIGAWLARPSAETRREPVAGFYLVDPQIVPNPYAKSFVAAFQTAHAAAQRDYAAPAKALQRALRRGSSARVRTALLTDMLQDTSLDATAAQIDFLRRNGADLDVALRHRGGSSAVGAPRAAAATRAITPPVDPDFTVTSQVPDTIVEWTLRCDHLRQLHEVTSPPFPFGEFTLCLVLDAGGFSTNRWTLRTQVLSGLHFGTAPRITDSALLVADGQQVAAVACTSSSMWIDDSGRSGPFWIPLRAVPDDAVSVKIVYTGRLRDRG